MAQIHGSTGRRLLQALDAEAAKLTVVETVLSEDAPNATRMVGHAQDIVDLQAVTRSLASRFDTHSDALRYLLTRLEEIRRTRTTPEEDPRVGELEAQVRWLVPIAIGGGSISVVSAISWLVVFGYFLAK
jgi:hypothetical protein